SLLAAACTFAIAGQAAAVHINESFDGAWVDPSAAGLNKGLMVDYIPSANTFFFAFFTYNNSGDQLWTVGAFEVQNGVRDYEVPVTIVEGGRFSEAGTPAESDPIGTASISVNCGAIEL